MHMFRQKTGCARHYYPTGMANPSDDLSMDSIDRVFRCRMPNGRDQTTRLCMKTRRDSHTYLHG
jgi:hypothetical protein